MANNKMKIGKVPNSKRNIPNVRFPGFNEEWEVKNLGDLCKMQAGKFINASEISDKKNDDLFPCFGGNGLRGYTKSYNQDGIYSLIGRQGALCGNVTLANGKFHATEHAVVVTPNNDIETIWMFYLLIYLNLNQYSTGMAQPGLSVQNLEKIKVVIPEDKIEQAKIASFLSLIDERIHTQNKIIEQLETLIKGLSEKLFSQKIRFNGFTDEWEEKSLGEVLIEPEQIAVIKPNEIELLTVKLHCKGIVNTGNYPAVTKNGRPYYKRFKNEILIGRQNFHNGGIGIVSDNNDGKICSNAISSYNVFNHNLLFVYYYIARPSYYKKADDLIGGTGQKEISKSEFSKLKILIPSIKEQTAIAQFLSSIDQKLQTEKDVLEQLEKQKKFLLQNLFV